MNNSKSFVVVLLMVFSLSFTTKAQDSNVDAHDVTINIPEVALVDIEPSGSTSLTFAPSAPDEAGDAISFASTSDNSLWINYSSIVGSTSDPSRSVSVSISSGSIPGGMNLKVKAASDAGNGAGTVGTPGSEVTLTGSAQNLITSIGSCYTGDGANNGHNLTYTLELSDVADYGDIDFDEATTVTITYTLSDN